MNKRTLEIAGQSSGQTVSCDFYENSLAGPRPLLLICPGGAYQWRSPREQQPIARVFQKRGMHVAVLQYSVAPARFPQATVELAAAVQYFQQQSSELGVDGRNIYVMGFSAGGHLALTYGVYWSRRDFWEGLLLEPELKPIQGLLLSYPVVSAGKHAAKSSMANLLGPKEEGLPYSEADVSLELLVTEDSALPPCFIWHTWADQSVPVENSLLLVQQIREKQPEVPVEFHVYETGPHGLALATEETDEGNGEHIDPRAANWPQAAGDWLELRFALNEAEVAGGDHN